MVSSSNSACSSSIPEKSFSMVEREATSLANSFEGPEKILEVDFIPMKSKKYFANRSLRAIPRDKWDMILSEAQCEILSKCSNNELDAYVLSESSLFVYERKAYIRTCGTTTLLLCLEPLLREAATVGLQLEWVGYSRKDFLFPQQQRFPHTSFAQEVEFARSACGEKLAGAAFVLGDITSDHCFVYVADFCERSEQTALDRNLNIMMYGLEPSVQKIFYRQGHRKESLKAEAVRAREESGIASMKALKGCVFDDTLFEPCGYSLNALKDEAFFTVHITPEEHCCYASFETNITLTTEQYRELLEEVLQVFKPQKFTMTMFADRAGLASIDCSPVEFKKIEVPQKEEKDNMFMRSSYSSSCFATDYVCQLANFVRRV